MKDLNRCIADDWDEVIKVQFMNQVLNGIINVWLMNQCWDVRIQGGI